MAGSRVTLRFRQQGFAEIRTAPKVMKMLNEVAEQTAGRAGDGFEATAAEVTGGRMRGRAAVVTTTYDAMKSQARDHTLEKALGGGLDG